MPMARRVSRFAGASVLLLVAVACGGAQHLAGRQAAKVESSRGTHVGANVVVTREAAVAESSLQQTSGASFVPVPGLSLEVSNRGPVTATFSGEFSGGPVEIRVQEGKHILAPGAARVDKSVTDSASFTYVAG